MAAVYREGRQRLACDTVSVPVGMAYDQGMSLRCAFDLSADQGGRQDDASALDLPTLRRWNLILRLFTLEYLGLDPPRVEEPAERAEEPWKSRHELVSVVRGV